LVILDTSIIIDLLYGVESIEKKIKQYEEDHEEMNITSIKAYELLRHPKEIKRTTANSILKVFSVYSFDKRASEKAADVYRELMAKGEQINENDVLIIGIAISKGEKLLTRDNKFAFIDDSKIEIV